MSKETHIRLPRFLRFASSSLISTGVDQAVAWWLFSLLRLAMPGSDFLRILVASVVARALSLTINFSINRRLVFSSQDGRQAHAFARFFALAAVVLGLSTVGVWWAHTTLGAPEWMAKVAMDSMLFFLNYNVQRTWVFGPSAPQTTYTGAVHAME